MPNGTWTWGAVGAFTVMSGYLLRLRYKDNTDIKLFYKKRLLTLFPSFYIAFLIGYIVHSIETGSMFYGGHPAKIIFTFLGIDSYVGLYGISTYAIVGEWYTGIIIIMYFLFPLLNWICNRIKLPATIGLIAVFIANCILRPNQNMPETSIFTAILLFWTGMIISDASEYLLKHNWIGIITLAAVVILIAVPIPVMPRIINLDIVSILLFLTLILLFSNLDQFKISNTIIFFLSGISYEIYLIHHFLVYELAEILPKVEGNYILSAGYYVLVLLISILMAFIINRVAKILIKTIANFSK